MRLLVQADCSLDLTSPAFVGDALSLAVELCNWPAYYYGYGNFRHLSSSEQKELHKGVQERIIQLLAGRRKDLHSRFMASSSASKFDTGMSADGQVLDQDAAFIEKLLVTLVPSPPRASVLLPNLPTVYHLDFLTVELAERFWQAGFRDIDVPALDGRTPLMLSSYLTVNDLVDGVKLTAWLVKKGASPHRPQYFVPNSEEKHLRSPTRALHYIAARIGSSATLHYHRLSDSRADIDTMMNDGGAALFRHCRDLTQGWLQSRVTLLDEYSKALVVAMLSDPSYDHCQCACSYQGCLSSTMMLKTAICHYARGYKKIPKYLWSNRLLTFDTYKLFSGSSFQIKVKGECALLVTEFLKELVGPSHACWEWLTKEVIRFQTFEALELRHTCCRGHCEEIYLRNAQGGWYSGNGPEGLDPEDVDEIQDEDREGIRLLESLLQEFEKNIGTQDLVSFLEGYWLIRVDQVFKERERARLDEEKLQDIGVILRPDETNEDSDDDWQFG